MKVFVSGIGQISGVGQGMEALRSAVAAQKPPQNFRVPEIQMPNTLPESVKRRMSRISKMFFVSVAEAISDSGQDLKGPRTGLIIGSAFCSQNLAIELERRFMLEGPTGVSPTLFAGSVQNSIASHLSISFGIEGPCSTVTTMDQTAEASLSLAYAWISQGIVDNVIVSIGDEVSEYLSYAFKNSVQSLGEGAVTFVLSPEGKREFHPSMIANLPRKHSAFYGEMPINNAFELALQLLPLS